MKTSTTAVIILILIHLLQAWSFASNAATGSTAQPPATIAKSATEAANSQSIFYKEPDKRLQEQILAGLTSVRQRTTPSQEVVSEIRDRVGKLKTSIDYDRDHIQWMGAHKDAAVLVLAELAVSKDVATRRQALYALHFVIDADKDVIIDKEGRRTTPIGDLALKLYSRSIRDRDKDVRLTALRHL